MSTVNVKVSKFSVQYMLKDDENDMPKVLPLRMFTVSLKLAVPDDLEPYIEQYISGFSDNGESEERIVPEYNAPKHLVEKWRKEFKEQFPDTIRSDTPPDAIMDMAIGFKLEDALESSLDAVWDKDLAKRLNAVPDVPSGYHLAGRYINLLDWSVTTN